MLENLIYLKIEKFYVYIYIYNAYKNMDIYFY